MKKNILSLLLIFSAISLLAAELTFDSDYLPFRLYNKNTKKILSYYPLQPGEKFELKAHQIDTLTVYSRLTGSGVREYSYKLFLNGEEQIIRKKTKNSSVSKALNGDPVSAYNSYVTGLSEIDTRVVLENISPFLLLVKFSGGNQSGSGNDIEYISYSPAEYDYEVILRQEQDEYTYFSAENRKIVFTIEGPAYLKVISRLIFDSNFINNSHYRYNVYFDDTLFNSFEEKANKSRVSVLDGDDSKIPSTGDTNIIQIPAGIHEIAIEDMDINRDLIFRVFISKTAVEISKP